MLKLSPRGLALVLCALSIVVLGGAGTSSASGPTTRCSQPDPQGRLVCVTVEDRDGVSPSGLAGSGKRQVDVVAYQFYKLTVTNAGGNTLTNGTMTVTLTDITPDGNVPSTAKFEPSGSSALCAPVAGSVRCSLANLPAGASTPLIVLGYRTSTTPRVTDTDAAISVSFKEGGNPNGANPSTFSFTERTNLEPDPESSVGWSPPGQLVRLGTSPTFDTQFSSLDYTVPTGKSAFISTMSEGAPTFCAEGITCFGEAVTTNLAGAEDGTFAATNLFHLRIVVSLDVAPGGSTDKIVLVHRLDDSSLEVISRRCSSSPPSTTADVPCITVVKDNKARLLIIDAWGFKNGGWVPGL